MTTLSRSFVVGLLLCSACSLFGGTKDTAAPEPTQAAIPQESKDMIRDIDAQTVESIKKMDEQIDENEAKLKAAIEVALGQAPAYQGGAVPAPAHETVAALRKAKITLYLEPVLDAQGKPVADGFVQLKDSYTDEVTKLSRKMAEGKASKKEMKFVQNGAKHMVAINDLKAQVRAAVDPAMASGWMVTTGSMTTMQMAGNMIKNRLHYEMEWTDEDYALIQQLLSSQQRREAVAAVSIGMMGAYQVAFAEGGDATVIEQIGKGTLEALPLKGEATLEDAKAYVANFEANVDASHGLYEDQMRKTFGDAKYEAEYKAQIDNMFAQARAATQTQSATEMMAGNQAKYEEHLRMCARGEEPPTDTMVGPGACDDAKANAGPDGSLSVEAMAALTGGVNAKDVAKKGVALVLEKIPGGKQVQRALEGVRALRNGDPSVALRLAADLVPMPGPAKMALSGAATIAESLPKAKRNAKRLRG